MLSYPLVQLTLYELSCSNVIPIAHLPLLEGPALEQSAEGPNSITY